MNLFDRFLARGEEVTNETARRARYAARGRESGGLLRRLLVVAGSAVAGAAAALLLDPARGRSRRARLADQAAATVRRGARITERAVRRVRGEVSGRMSAMRHANSEGDPFPDDVTLSDRVQSELFRDERIPKGQLNVNVERGIVVLRGEVPDESMRADLAQRVEAMPGVWAVRNLLHLPGETAPHEAVAVS
ncbi:MAG TPA: BON domain-containing protein [Candidatus Angelobacter sp.]|nr:BON domain-containing protein [Candidatus Angelobacter sp.]